jgi:hypothetical protein
VLYIKYEYLNKLKIIEFINKGAMWFVPFAFHFKYLAGPQPVAAAGLEQRREEQEQDQAGDGSEAGALGERGQFMMHF